MYRRPHNDDKEYRPMILNWLYSRLCNDIYNHSFKDQWLRWYIWDGMLSIGLDFRVSEQKDIFDRFPLKFKGCKQTGTGKIVNETTLYFNIDEICEMIYPEINSHKLLKKIRHIDNDGDTFYEYEWEVFLNDNTSIYYCNQKDKMDLQKGDHIYNVNLQTRAFFNFLKANHDQRKT